MYINSKKLSLTVLSLTIFAACTTQYPTSTVTSTSPPIAQPIGSPFAPNYVHTAKDVQYRVVSYRDLPNWQNPNQDFAQSLLAFKRGCSVLQRQSQWTNVCQQANQIHGDATSAKSFFEQYFTPWQVSQAGNTNGLFTGYYEPMLSGDLVPTAQARFPIYGIPNDLVTVSVPNTARNNGTVRITPTGANRGVVSSNGSYSANLAQFAKSNEIKGRFVGNQFMPYYTRNEINGGALNGIAPILGYANDPVDLLFLHIQGSGRLQTPSGQVVRLGYADKNDHPYGSVGKYMADMGYLPLAQTSMQNIRSYMAQNPHRLAEILAQNPRYIFFTRTDANGNEGPKGAMGVPLTDGYSGAVDRRYITMGAPIFISTTHPDTQAALNRLIMAQDVGSAIQGAVRVDYFWGFGDAAGQTAGKMKNQGSVWQLLPNGVLPNP